MLNLLTALKNTGKVYPTILNVCACINEFIP